jgi:hypothetical protein
VTDTTTTTTTKETALTTALGPRRQKTAKRYADYIWAWGMDLQKAVQAGDLGKISQLTAAVRETADDLDILVKRASKETR